MAFGPCLVTTQADYVAAGGHEGVRCEILDDAGNRADRDALFALAREHVAWMRRVHPDAAPRTATLKRLARDLDPAGTPFGARVAGLGLDTVDLGPWEDVVDPAGGDIDVFVACAGEIAEHFHELAPRLC